MAQGEKKWEKLQEEMRKWHVAAARARDRERQEAGKEMEEGKWRWEGKTAWDRGEGGEMGKGETMWSLREVVLPAVR